MVFSGFPVVTTYT